MHESKPEARRSRRILACAAGFCAAALLAGPASAGDGFQPKPPAADQARCNAMGEGYFAVKGSNACIRISGYVASGVDFGGSLRRGNRNLGLFGARVSSGVDSEAGVNAEARFDTPLGPGRLYIQTGRETFNR